VGDYVYPTQANGYGASFVVATLSGSAVATVLPVRAGRNYSTATGLATTTSGSGTGCTLNITTTANTMINSDNLHPNLTGYLDMFQYYAAKFDNSMLPGNLVN
jgi:hypothetical protein